MVHYHIAITRYRRDITQPMAAAISSSSFFLLSATPAFIRAKVRTNISGRLFDGIGGSTRNGVGIEGCNAKHRIVGLSITSIAQPGAVIRSSVGRAFSAATSLQETENSAENLLGTLLSTVEGTDRGAMLSNEEHERVLGIVSELERFCIPEPLKSPFILGEWDVEYCSNPTSPGGYYRSAIGRLLLKTNEMTQSIQAPDVVGNRVAFSAFNAIDGEVSLKGKFMPLDNKWIEITFDAPSLKFGPFNFQYGGESTVKIAIIYLDERIRLGRGSRGSIFIFKRRG